MERSLLGIDEIHRHLGLSVDLETQAFDVAESAGGAAHRLGDVLGDLEIRRRSEIHVVRDQKGSRPDGDGAAGRMDRSGAEIRIARGLFAELVAEPLELTATDVGEIFARGCSGGALVEVNGYPQLATDALA